LHKNGSSNASPVSITRIEVVMSQRLSIKDVDPAAHEAVLGLERYVRRSGIDPLLYELVKIRASQLNGCAFCLDMHHRDARKKGEDQRRLDVLSAWREAPELFDERERAALALTEAVTRIGDQGVPDAVWSQVAACFEERERVHLLMAIATINVWNRLAVATHQALPELASAYAQSEARS
jgi:AhpD family alkylhydroperoxidase